MKTQLVKILFALLALCFSTTAFTKDTDYYTAYSGYSAMMELLKENCKDYSKSYHFNKLLKASRNKKVSRVTDFFSFEHVVSLTSFDGAKCNYALAQNTIEGMSFILANRPKSSFMHNDANKAIAKALLVQWGLDSTDELEKFAKAKNHIETFLQQDDDDYKLGKASASYFVGHDIIEVAQFLERQIEIEYPKGTTIRELYSNHKNSKVLTLYQLAADYGQKGFDKAIDKSAVAEPLSQSLIALAERYPTHSKEQTKALQQLEGLFGFPLAYRQSVASIYLERNDFAHMKSWIEALKPLDAFNCSRLWYFGSDSIMPLDPKQLNWLKDFLQKNCEKHD